MTTHANITSCKGVERRIKKRNSLLLASNFSLIAFKSGRAFYNLTLLCGTFILLNHHVLHIYLLDLTESARNKKPKTPQFELLIKSTIRALVYSMHCIHAGLDRDNSSARLLKIKKSFRFCESNTYSLQNLKLKQNSKSCNSFPNRELSFPDNKIGNNLPLADIFHGI